MTESQKSLSNSQNTVRAGLSKRALQECGVPKFFKDKVALIQGNKIHEEALKAIREGKGLLLFGKCGTGKTRLAIGLMINWFADNLKLVKDSYTEREEVRATKGKPRFLFVTDLLNEIKRSWDEKENTRGQNEQDIVNYYYKIPFLVLDDLGSEKLSEWSRSILSALINKRHIECKQTIVTTNLTHEQLAKYDDRIASRLCEMGEVYDLGEKDWRIKK